MLKYDGPIVLVVMDGVGIAPAGPGNAVKLAHTEFLDKAGKEYLNIPLRASGEAVGILKGDMGNSEVGHNDSPLNYKLQFTNYKFIDYSEDNAYK